MHELPSAGSLVAWWNEGELQCAVLGGEEKRRVWLVGADGRESRVTPARVAFVIEGGGASPGRSPEERQQAGARAAEMSRRVSELAESCEVAVVWELALQEEGPFDVAALAELAFGTRAGPERAALIRALQIDRVHFARKGEDWEPRPADAVESLLLERRRAVERTEQKRRLFEGLRGLVKGRPFEPADDETERRYLAALDEFAMCDFEASEGARSLATEALSESGIRSDRPHEGAFKLLRQLGRYASDDENLHVRRYGLRDEFPRTVLDHAEAAASRELDAGERRDLTALEAVTIDSVRTREIDDALTVEPRTGGGWLLGVHIADPAARIEPGDPIDEEALRRGITHYLPQGKLLMIPEAISERAASLTAGEERPALSFMVELGPDGAVAGFEIVRSMIRPRARLSYEDADRAMQDGGGPYEELLRSVDRATGLLERRRREAGAVRIVSDEVDVFVDGDGGVVLERQPAESPARRAVSEAMVLAGSLAARFCVEHELPAIYRRQAASEPPIDVPPDGSWDAVSAFDARRRMRRGEVGLEPGSHYGLGLEAYAQATSPLRRFQDLATHRQIRARLAGEPPPYDREGLQRILAATEQAELDARRIERASNRYWLLRYLEQQRARTVPAVVLAVEPRTVIQLEETLIEQPLPSLKGVEPGQRVELEVRRVNPRADLLSLRG
jgi:exoribonuclease-2